MEDQHPAQLRHEPRHRKTPGVEQAGEVRQRLVVVRRKRHDAAFARIVLRDGQVRPAGVVVDGVRREHTEVNDTDAAAAEHRQQHQPWSCQGGERPLRAIAPEEHPQVGHARGDQGEREAGRKHLAEQVQGTRGVHEVREGADTERHAEDQRLEQRQLTFPKHARQQQLPKREPSQVQQRNPAVKLEQRPG